VAETPGVGDAPLFIGFQQGLFRKAGLEVRITNYPPPRAGLNALQGGAMDVAFGDDADMFYAQAQAKANKGASLLTIGQYPSTVSASDLQRVIALMFFFNAIPSQPSVKAMIFH
jgi:ABC-type nitrate/sulfonate/bicarbonate transport system substrate-binding protein